MRISLAFTLFVFVTLAACKKTDKSVAECSSDALTVRTITNKQALIRVTTGNPVYIVEQGSIDGKLIPCSLPTEFYQDNLQVIISGEVKSTQQVASGPCCMENFVITKITR